MTRAGAVLAVCCVGQFLVVLDVAIVNVALPDVFADLRMGPSSQLWVVNAYTITLAGFLLLGGRAGDLLGRRRVFLAGLATFTGASLFGGLAPDGGVLIAARTLQGLGGAVLAPTSLGLLTAAVTDPERRRRAVGAWSATAASGSAVGALAGGVLTDLLGWRSVLLVAVPIGAATLATGHRVLPADDAGRAARGLDLPGACLVTASVGALTYAVLSGAQQQWTASGTLGAFAAALVLFAGFLWTETALAAHPLVPLTVFRHRRLVLANLIALIVGASMFGLYYYLSLYLQRVAHDSPVAAGLSFLPAGLATFACALAAPRAVARLGARAQLALGVAGVAAGLFWLSALGAGDGYAGHILGPLLLVGGGLGISFLPMTLAATEDVPPAEAGLAAGLVTTSRQLGGALGLAGAGAVVAASTGAPPAGYTAAWAALGAVVLAALALCAGLPAHDRSAKRLAGSGARG